MVFAHRYRHLVLFTLTMAALIVGGAAWLLAAPALRDGAWMAAAILMLAVLIIETVRELAKGEAGIDLLALLAIGGSLLLHEYLAGAVIALMLASGRALEEYAAGRARRELSALLGRTPQVTHRYHNGELVEIAVEEVVPEDRLLVRPGEVLPVDGLLLSETALLDESALTGEAMPVTRYRGERLASGVVNAGEPLELRALADAAGSTYAGVVRLVEQAQEAKAPFTRLADRYALLFVPLTLAIAGLAWWWSGDPVRALAVLVVA
ncbi:MAG TPA: heavy metal translocating P-type ATPase, partial [Gammaproteobacteria bacterium]|nr:heavy metal translocating P-type ATPase [Gammaproteobacteria bacterium]